MAKEAPHLLIVEARFYEDIADNLRDSAVEVLQEHSATFDVVSVPGVLEVPAAVAFALQGKFGEGISYDGFIALGCVIRGETTHYEIVSNESARALMDISVGEPVALGNGILTVENSDQAWARAEKGVQNKGGDAAVAALAMIKVSANFSTGDHHE